MQNLIEQLLESEGFARKPSTGLALYEYSCTGKTNYWLVIYGEPIITPEIQAEWLNECKEVTADPALEKNINLLIVWNTDSNEEFVSKRVNYIEEDCYFFKKHVLHYTDEEFEALSRQIDARGFATFFRESITMANIFSEYKLNYLEGSWQSLLYRLAIKLPFVAINSEGNSSLASLERNIKDGIQKVDNSGVLAATDAAIDSIVRNITLPDALAEDLLILIDNELSEAGYESDR